jgi:hypothetical protein
MQHGVGVRRLHVWDSWTTDGNLESYGHFKGCKNEFGLMLQALSFFKTPIAESRIAAFALLPLSDVPPDGNGPGHEKLPSSSGYKSQHSWPFWTDRKMGTHPEACNSALAVRFGGSKFVECFANSNYIQRKPRRLPMGIRLVVFGKYDGVVRL